MMELQKLLSEIEGFYNSATETERKTLESLFQAIKEKKEGKYRSYLAALTKVNSKFTEDGNYEVTIPIQPLINNPLNIVHGGITATLIDTAMGSFVNQSVPEHSAAVTTELKINYLKPGIGEKLTCTASIIHKGSSIWVCEAKVVNEENSLIAIGTGSFFIIKRPK